MRKLHFFSLIENLWSFIIRQCHTCQYAYTCQYICKRRRIPCNSQLFIAERNVWETDIRSYLFHVFLFPSFHPPFSYSQCPSAPLTRASYYPPSVLCRGHRVIRPSVAPRLTLSALDRKSMFFSSQLRSIAVQRQFVPFSQLFRMIVSSLWENGEMNNVPFRIRIKPVFFYYTHNQYNTLLHFTHVSKISFCSHCIKFLNKNFKWHPRCKFSRFRYNREKLYALKNIVREIYLFRERIKIEINEERNCHFSRISLF